MLNKNQAILKETLDRFSLECEMRDIWTSPSIVTYTLRPSGGIKLSDIVSLSNDFSLALAMHPIRVVALDNDASLIGIEVPNEKKVMVSIEEELYAKEYKDQTGNLIISVGRDTKNNHRYIDLRKETSLLIGGATGSGKTNFFHSIFASLVERHESEELKFIMADGKRIEFQFYNGSAYLLRPAISDYKEILSAFEGCLAETDRRLALMANANFKTLEEYNEKAKEKLSYIVILIDEFSDFAHVDENERLILIMVKVIQSASSAGIVLVAGSSRPCSETFPPMLMENCPSRLALQTASTDDSQFILGESGAERLLGNGDGLFRGIESREASNKEAYPIRLQTPRVRDK